MTITSEPGLGIDNDNGRDGPLRSFQKKKVCFITFKTSMSLHSPSPTLLDDATWMTTESPSSPPPLSPLCPQRVKSPKKGFQHLLSPPLNMRSMPIPPSILRFDTSLTLPHVETQERGALCLVTPVLLSCWNTRVNNMFCAIVHPPKMYVFIWIDVLSDICLESALYYLLTPYRFLKMHLYL